MSKKFFTLIKQGSIHIAPKTKVIPDREFSTLMEAQTVLTLVHQDVEEYKMLVIDECETLKAQAQKEGFEAGFSQWVEKIAEVESEIQKVRRDLEQMLIPVALKAAKKIVGREIELSQETIVDIVSNALKGVAQHKKVTIYVNKKDLAILDAHRSKIKLLFEGLEALSIRERSDINQGGCVIETEGGIINAQIENQWRVLEKAFENLMQAKEAN